MTPLQQFEKLNNAPNLDLELRIKRLKSLKSTISTYSSAIVEALNEDYGRRSESETKIAEILICIEEIKHTLQNINSWVKPQVSYASYKFMFSKNALVPQPLGVVGIISPWNYPFNLAIDPLIAAIAAGNKVMLKPSEITPKTSQLMSDMLAEVFLDTEVAVVLGGLEVAQQFSALPFKHILFTGSSAVGKIIMQAAANNLTPVTLELGGKSPVIIDEKYNIKTAAKSIVAGKFFNAGQTCIAPDYILVNENQQQPLIDALKIELNKCFADVLNNRDYTAIINNNHYERLSKLAKNCETNGQCIWPLGNKKIDDINLFPPLLVINPDINSHIMQSEIFGPILPILTVKSCDDAISIINSQPNPLTLYLFSNRSRVIKKVLKQTLSGSAAINETLVQFAQDGIPFGGVGESGMGSYHGKKGFMNFSHVKSIYYQTRLNFNSMVRAPFTPIKKIIIKFMSSS